MTITLSQKDIDDLLFAIGVAENESLMYTTRYTELKEILDDAKEEE